MVTMKTALLTAFATTSIAASVTAAVAQDASERKVEQYSCRDIMREGGTNRDTAIAFLHGFLLGQSGRSSFNLETLTKQTDAFIDHCLDNPNDKAMDAMMKTKI
jgi:HdeA/HdeB family